MAQPHKILAGEQWIEARRQLLIKEKEFTKARDALSQHTCLICFRAHFTSSGKRSMRSTTPIIAESIAAPAFAVAAVEALTST